MSEPMGGTIATTPTARNEIFTLLSNERRQYVVRALQELDPPVELGELAEYIAAYEQDKPVARITSEERRRVYTSLQQVHLDKLEDADVIECDRKEISPTERLEELEFYLEAVPEDEIPWAEYYLGLSGVGAAVVAAGWIGIYPDALSGYVWATLVVAVFGVSALAHTYTRRRESVHITDWFDGENNE